MPLTTGVERLRESKERKKRSCQQRSQKYYKNNKEKISQRRKARKAARDKRPIAEQNRTEEYQNRTSRKRALDKVKDAFPDTPVKRRAIVASLVSSPSTRTHLQSLGLCTTPAEQEGVAIAQATLTDATTALQSTKHRRSNDARAATKTTLSFLTGETITKGRLTSKVAKKLKINRRRLSQAFQHRTKTLRSEKACWIVNKRKIRSDAIPEKDKKKAYDYWASPEVSRPTGNKKDIMRRRIARKTFVSHPKQILEKTQTEAFLQFKRDNPNIKMGQRAFEKCKPFYVIPPRRQDRNTCCCRTHVEMRMVFASCMEFRRKTLLTAADASRERFPVYEHLTDLIEETLCPKPNDSNLHQRKCIYRSCNACGMSKLNIMPEEQRFEEIAPRVKWQKFQYCTNNATNQRKLHLTVQETSPGEMFEHLKSLLQSFPSHQFRANWQHTQMNNLVDNLPQGHACCIHDYSENYSCQYQDQLQTMYFSQTQASIHVTILHRHAIKDIDGEQSTEAEPVVVTEHLFVISNDCTHNHHSVHEVRSIISDYLKSIKCTVEVMHEFTDGCSAQYKSRHCMGDVTHSATDFGYKTIRNYYETSHAKGPQDGAGANLKHKADMAVIKRQVVIQNAKDLYDFAQTNLQQPAPSRYQSENVALKRRVFFYLEQTEQNRPHRHFKEIRGNRTIHSICSTERSLDLKVRELSCYCDQCLNGQYDDCQNTEYVDNWEERVMEREGGHGRRQATRSVVQEQRESLKDLACLHSTVAIASGDQGQEYYLLKVCSDGSEKLGNPTTDAWNSSFPAGAEVIRGHFYILENVQVRKRAYTLNEEKEAVVYAATVRYICSDLEIQNICDKVLYCISESQHLDILDALEGF